MSFFNFGPSPTKSSDASNAGDGNGDFNMYGGGTTGTGSFFGGGIVEPVDSSTGSIFSGGPGAAEAGGSMFGSTAGSGATRQQEDASPGIANYGLHGISPPRAAKMIKQDPSQAQAASSTVSATWGAPPHPTARPAPSPSTALGPPQPDSRSHQIQEAQSYGQSHNPQHHGRPVYEAPIMSNQKPPAHINSTESHNNYQLQAQAPPPVSDSSAQSLALREKTDDDLKKDEVEEMSADVLLKEMIDMQKQQLYELVPQMKRSEEMSEQILTSASMVLRDVTNYGEKLAVTKQLYCSRLSQVSSCLRMIPKTEK